MNEKNEESLQKDERASWIEGMIHDKSKCRSHVRPLSEEYVKARYGFDGYGCGLCQTGVPCESKIPMPADFSNRLLKNAHLRRCPHPSLLRRTGLYDSLLGISGALYLDVFEPPVRRVFFRLW
jgi:hypothetical protein